MNNSKKAFLHNLNPIHPELILMNMDLFALTKMIKFGEQYSQDAQEQAIENKLLGREHIANAIARDVTVINKNVASLKDAYKLAMN